MKTAFMVIIAVCFIWINSFAISLCDEIQADPNRYFSNNLDINQDFILSSDTDYKCDGSLYAMEFLNNLYNLSVEIRGDSIDCDGTHALVRQKQFQYTLAKVGMAPEVYKKKLPSNEAYEEIITANRKYFRTWAHKSISNYELYNKFNKEYKNSLPKLIDYYKTKFGYDEGSAIYYATRGINEYLNYAVGSYGIDVKFSELEDLISNPNFTTNDLASYIYSKNISQLELNNALDAAILENRSIDFIDTLLKRGANINAGDESSLFFALRNLAHVKFLISKGADVGYKNSFGKTPIFYAVAFNDKNLINLLLLNGADINATYISSTEKMALASSSYEPFYQNLCALNHTSRTLFMHAAQNANLEIVEFLVEKGADINAVDDLGYNALDYAIYAEKKQTVKYLKSIGLNSNVFKGDYDE